MFATAPPVPIDPSQLYLTIPHVQPPPPPPAPIRSKSRLPDILKIFVGLLIALILAGILAFLLFVPHTSNGVDLRESNEKIAELQRQSNENIARLQREQAISMQEERIKHQEDLIHQQLLAEMQRFEKQNNLTQEHRLEDRLNEQLRREQDLQISMELSRQDLEIKQRHLQLLLEERLLADERRKEELNNKNDDLLTQLIEDINAAGQPVNPLKFQLRILSLIRRFNPPYKSLLISYLYKFNLLNGGSGIDSVLNLHGANLNYINLGETDIESDQASLSLDYFQLTLPSLNLINSSFEKLSLNQANFSMSNMMGTSFRSSKVAKASFAHCVLSLSNFQYTDVSQSNFSFTKIQRASFENAYLIETHMDYADLSGTKFTNAIAIQANFFRSEMSNAEFQYAHLFQARMENISMRTGNFYFAKAAGANFTYSYMASCLFHWTDLTDASFSYATLMGSSFENANVQNVDFTGAFLAGVIISPGQLDVVLSIANAILPDGSRGKNKNLVKNGHAECTGINGVISDWTKIDNVVVIGNQFDTECTFQAKTDSATLQQAVDIRRYERLIKGRPSKVYIEMDDKTTEILNPSVYMTVRFFDSDNIDIVPEQSTLGITSSTLSPKFTTTLMCPSNTVTLQINIVFRQTNATVDNIYVTIE